MTQALSSVERCNFTFDFSNSPVADPDFELRRGHRFTLLAQPAFHPSVISSFFTQNKVGGGGGGGGPLP